MKRLRKHMSYSNVTATLALVLALTGVAYAAALADNSVRSRHIAPNAAKGVDVEESTFGAVPTARGLKHPDFGRISTSQLIDGIGVGMVLGRVDGVGNTALLYANPLGDDVATVTESVHLMGTYLSGSEAEDFKVQMTGGPMPAGTSRRFTLRAGGGPASMADTVVTCQILAGQSQCGFEGKVALSQLQDMLSIEIETTGAPGTQAFVFGYRFSFSPGT